MIEFSSMLIKQYNKNTKGYKMQNITITNSAAKKVLSLLQEENDPTLKIRIFVQGGGCSGFQYGFTFDQEKADDDISIKKEIENTFIEFLIDPISNQYLDGIEIDYSEDLKSSQFIIKNPNAVSTCGCGSSFSV